MTADDGDTVPFPLHGVRPVQRYTLSPTDVPSGCIKAVGIQAGPGVLTDHRAIRDCLLLEQFAFSHKLYNYNRINGVNKKRIQSPVLLLIMPLCSTFNTAGGGLTSDHPDSPSVSLLLVKHGGFMHCY